MAEKVKKSPLISLKDLSNFQDIGIFIALLLVFTVVGYLWKLSGYKLFGVAVLTPVYAILIKGVLVVSGEILRHLLFLDIVIQYDTNSLISNNTSMLILNGCSGLKEMAMYLFIMLLFPGPWKAKLWFIPLSLMIIFAIVILRVVALFMLLDYHPAYYLLFHNFLLNYIFFGIFFLLWLFWVKYFYLKHRRPGKPEPS